uniref:F-box domain-containing protein n=1 Tax=Oryza glaberrima TaxID=4538 RepID=I1QGE0_ORYGL
MSLEETNPTVVEEEDGEPGSAEEDAVAYGEVQVFDEMPLNETDPAAAAEEGEPGSAEEDAVASGEDRLSEMPDMVLHHVMSFLKAWEAARTCVLSRRWRHLWASAPCVDILLTSDRQPPPPANRRMRHHQASAPCPCADVLWTRDRNPPSDTRRFVNWLLLARDELAPVDTLRLRSAHVDGFEDKFKNADVEKWISEAIKRKARVIQLEDHYGMFVVLAHQVFASNHLKILKLSYTELDDDIFRGFSSRCPSLEELELKKCVVSAREISSVTLKSLIMVECKFTMNLSVGAPNLVFLQCITPMKWVPVLKDSGSLVTGSIMIDDSLLIGDSKKRHEVDGFSSDYSYGGSSEDYFDDLSSDISDDYDYNYGKISIVMLIHMSTRRLRMDINLSSLKTMMMEVIAVWVVNIMAPVLTMGSMMIKLWVDKMFFTAFQMLEVWSC